ncbi:hypothetical protein L210DRAFT_3571391 [Boletus edulis BED1]|uniref:Uncharacterized protein n=1 Tax=Boletus edulis BED1 TaxID=1328754 RepID=A0AAD4G7B1_BOLED|nr:hypothetical protein L210DRAFT_3571391 [Boletus edulis BED1]
MHLNRQRGTYPGNPQTHPHQSRAHLNDPHERTDPRASSSSGREQLQRAAKSNRWM